MNCKCAWSPPPPPPPQTGACAQTHAPDSVQHSLAERPFRQLRSLLRAPSLEALRVCIYVPLQPGDQLACQPPHSLLHNPQAGTQGVGMRPRHVSQSTRHFFGCPDKLCLLIHGPCNRKIATEPESGLQQGAQLWRPQAPPPPFPHTHQRMRRVPQHAASISANTSHRTS